MPAVGDAERRVFDDCAVDKVSDFVVGRDAVEERGDRGSGVSVGGKLAEFGRFVEASEELSEFAWFGLAESQAVDESG